eukprot:COSAG06_NODE_29800_length_550_cov_0.898004_2_plen_52_part_01
MTDCSPEQLDRGFAECERTWWENGSSIRVHFLGSRDGREHTHGCERHLPRGG